MPLLVFMFDSSRTIPLAHQSMARYLGGWQEGIFPGARIDACKLKFDLNDVVQWKHSFTIILFGLCVVIANYRITHEYNGGDETGTKNISSRKEKIILDKSSRRPIQDSCLDDTSYQRQHLIYRETLITWTKTLRSMQWVYSSELMIINGDKMNYLKFNKPPVEY